MLFLTARGGQLIAAKHIVSISGLMIRDTGNVHDIEYCVGSEPRATQASEEDVLDFLEEV
jgi:hypothetical protein